jgi:hypothetical protein
MTVLTTIAAIILQILTLIGIGTIYGFGLMMGAQLFRRLTYKAYTSSDPLGATT